MKYIFDLDDFCDEYNCLQDLITLKEILPNLKVTLFTIPKKISKDLLLTVGRLDWIELAVHGLNHDSNYEFSKLTKEEAKQKLDDAYDPEFYIKGFKPAGWQISKEAMEVLKEEGYWLAVQYEDGRYEGNPDGPYQPKVLEGSKYYALNDPPEGYLGIHGHTWDCCGNGLREGLWKTLTQLPKDAEFVFISEII